MFSRLRDGCSLGALLAGPILLAGMPAAQAAKVPADLMGAQTQSCVQYRAKTDPLAPKDAARVPAYCGCVSEQYWASVPQADFDGMWAEHRAQNFEGPYSRSINERLKERLAAAQRQCGSR